MFASSAWVAFGPMSLWGNIAAAAGLAIALVLDTADGHLARLQGTASAFGRWLDEVLDESADMALHAAIAWGAWQRHGQPLWIVLGMTYGMGKYLFRVATESSPDAAEAGGEATHGPLRSTPPRRLVRLLGHADVRWHLWIALALAGRLELALAAYAIYFPARAGANLLGKAIRHARG
ncbi:MAG: CDP-alcohol phosphatidyltransferase family protein [Isosphaeraceae bacterium]